MRFLCSPYSLQYTDYTELNRKIAQSTTNSIGSSRPIKHLRILTQKPNSTINKIKTANASSSHSYQITIKELMIMLPLHGQNTAALQLINVSGQTILQKLT